MVIIVYFVVIAAAFFLLIVLPQRRRATAHRALIEALGVGDEVVTIGGIFGTIRAIEDDRIQLEVAPEVVVTVARNAIAQAAHPTEPEPTLDDHPADHPADNGASDD
jgi:preprotein translocase subunit YajC